MIRSLRFFAFLAFVVVAGVMIPSGCRDAKDGGRDTAPKTAPKKDAKTDHDHGETGPHGGPVGEWEDTYHVELTFNHPAKQVVVYVLDDKAKAAPKIDVAKITKVQITFLEPKDKGQVDLTHDAKLSNDKGIAFVGNHDLFAKPTDLKLAISGKVDGKRYVGDVTYTAPKASALYLKPGGIYTMADVKANGATTPTEKLKGIRWLHGKDLQPGDRICPVTDQKAQKECAWIVQGQRYEFCCPPCLDNFIEWAHFEPGKVKKADDYIFTVK